MGSKCPEVVAAMFSHRGFQSLLVLSCVLAGLFGTGCSEKEFDLTTPESTIRSYVNAYNSGNAQLMRRCGMARDLKDVFTRTDYDVDSNPIKVPVDGIQWEIVASKPGKQHVTRMFTTQEIVLTIHFTSKYDTDFDKTVKVRLESKRTVYDEQDTWQIY